jgi:hypothetical protein
MALYCQAATRLLVTSIMMSESASESLAVTVTERVEVPGTRSIAQAAAHLPQAPSPSHESRAEQDRESRTRTRMP